MTYYEWGFTENIFKATDPLGPNARDAALLIGRDKELQQLNSALCNPPRIPTVEGPNGIGKTSLINVCAFNAYTRFRNTATGSFLIPCREQFQLTRSKTAETFEGEVLLGVARTLILERQTFSDLDRASPRLRHLEKWLTSPALDGWQISLGISPISAGAGATSAVNTGEGFLRSGLRGHVLDELSRLFRAGEGVVCIIDNLELLEESTAARRVLEEIRDRLLHIPGIRWVVAGAQGIINGVASSPRLEGFFYSPIVLGGIAREKAGDILTARQRAFGWKGTTRRYLPLLPEDFLFLYERLRENLRSTFSKADEYCCSVDSSRLPLTPDEKRKAFAVWFRAHCEQTYRDIQSSQSPRGWRVFDRAAQLGGTFRPSDFEEFECSSTQHLREYTRPLESVGLLSSITDESDNRRRTNEITSKGWLVYHARCIQGEI